METKINAEWAKSRGFECVKATLFDGTYFEQWERIIDGFKVEISCKPSDNQYCSTIKAENFDKNIPEVLCWLDTEERMMKAIDFCKNFYK